MIQEPKSKAATRSVRLPAETVAALRLHHDRRTFQHRKVALGTDHDLVFCTGNGLPLNPNNVLRNFAALIAAAGGPKIRLHDLRHTHATLLLTDGVPVKVVSERLGHAKTSITMDIYARCLPEMQERAVESIGTALFG